MKVRKIVIAAVVGLALCGFVSVSYGGGYNSPKAGKNRSSMESYVNQLPKQILSKVEISDLMHMAEEEKLAHDVYLKMGKIYNLRIFYNIAKSESWHQHMIGLLLKKYGLKNPSEGYGDGEFSNPEFEKLYRELVKKGKSSLVNALKVGAEIEDLDIYDLQKAIKRTDNKDIKFVYEKLKMGSENHIRAFIRTLKRYGGSYRAKYISEQELEDILSAKGVRKRGKLIFQ